MDLLALADQSPYERDEYITGAKNAPFTQHDCITCMDILKLNVDEATAVSMLVLGTENRMVYILDSKALAVVMKVELDSVPAFIVANGL